MEINCVDVCIIQLEDVVFPHKFLKHVQDKKKFPFFENSHYSLFLKRLDDYSTSFLKDKLKTYHTVAVYSTLPNDRATKYMTLLPSVSNLIVQRKLTLYFPGTRGKIVQSRKSKTGAEIKFEPIESQFQFKLPVEEIIYSVNAKRLEAKKRITEISKVVLYGSNCICSSLTLKYLQKYICIKAVKIFELRNEEFKADDEAFTLVDSPSPTFLSIQLRQLEDNEKKVERKFDGVSQNFHITYESIYRIKVNDSWLPGELSRQLDRESTSVTLRSLLFCTLPVFREMLIQLCPQEKIV